MASHRRPKQRIARLIITMIEGPPMQWWAPPAAAAAGIFFLMIPEPAVRVGGLLLLIPGAAWTASRWWQYQHYQRVARDGLRPACLRCKYSLAGIEADICPECGCSQREEIAKAKRVAQES